MLSRVYDPVMPPRVGEFVQWTAVQVFEVLQRAPEVRQLRPVRPLANGKCVCLGARCRCIHLTRDHERVRSHSFMFCAHQVLARRLEVLQRGFGHEGHVRRRSR